MVEFFLCKRCKCHYESKEIVKLDNMCIMCYNVIKYEERRKKNEEKHPIMMRENSYENLRDQDGNTDGICKCCVIL